MDTLAYVAFSVLLVLLLLLLWKIYLLRQAARALREGIERQRESESNTLLSLPCRDREMLALADCLNDELRTLRDARRRYAHGDLELKEALTNLSHDLRTPLTAIFGNLALLEREETSETVSAQLEQITLRAQALKDLTEELFRYTLATTVEALHPEPVELRAALEEALLSLYGALRQRGITPSLSLPAEPVVRNMDRGALSRVLNNILSNALKYSGGDLSVTMTPKGVLCFSNAAPKLDAVAVGRLFERFYTVETAGSSTGLGLSIAKVLTERMGGRIGAECRDGVLTVTLSFPG